MTGPWEVYGLWYPISWLRMVRTADLHGYPVAPAPTASLRSACVVGQAGEDDVQPEGDAGAGVILQLAGFQDAPEVGVALLVGDRAQVGEALLLACPRGGGGRAGGGGGGGPGAAGGARGLRARGGGGGAAWGACPGGGGGRAGEGGDGAQVPVDEQRCFEALAGGQADLAGDGQGVLDPHDVVGCDRHAGDGRIQQPGVGQVALEQPGCPSAQPGLPRLPGVQVRRGAESAVHHEQQELVA